MCDQEARREEAENLQEQRGVGGSPGQKGPPEEESQTGEKKTKRLRRALPKAMTKPVERVSYAVILKNLKSRINSEELGATDLGIRETRSKDLLVEVCIKRQRETRLCL